MTTASLLWLSSTSGRPAVQRVERQAIVAGEHLGDRSADDALDVLATDLRLLVESAHDHSHASFAVSLAERRRHAPRAADRRQLLVGDDTIRLARSSASRIVGIRPRHVEHDVRILTGGAVDQRCGHHGMSMWPIIARSDEASTSSPIFVWPTTLRRKASSIRSTFSSASATENRGSSPEEHRRVAVGDVQVDQQRR